MRFKVCDDPEDVRSTQALRFEVYCEEKGWIDPSTCPEGLEADEFDLRAIHFLATDDDGTPLGTSRLILGSRETLPAAEHLDLSAVGLDPADVVEYSRLAIKRSGRSQDLRVFLGLTMSAWQWSTVHSMKAWLAVSDLPLFHLLRRLGLPAIAVGPRVHHLGSECIAAAYDMPLTGPVLVRRGARQAIFPFDVDVMIAGTRDPTPDLAARR